MGHPPLHPPPTLPIPCHHDYKDNPIPNNDGFYDTKLQIIPDIKLLGAIRTAEKSYK